MEDSAHILVVDDDDRLRGLLRNYLSEQSYRVTSAESAADARSKMKNITFDLIVLDLMMPGEHGLDFANSIRGQNQFTQDIPILMLTAMDGVEDRISGLEVGGDDYMVKPFEPRELLLRIKNILKRVRNHSEAVPLEAFLGEMVFDLTRDELRNGEKVIALTSGETRMLKILAERPGAIFSREDLNNLLAMDGGERAIDVQVNRLRRKIEKDPKTPRFLQTVRGRGYIFRPD